MFFKETYSDPKGPNSWIYNLLFNDITCFPLLRELMFE